MHCVGKGNFIKNRESVLESAKRAQNAIRGTVAWNKGIPNKHAMGEKSHLWRGGVTSKNVKIRHSIKYKKWRELVFERDDYTCQNCKKRGIYLEAHHKKGFSKYPKLRFDVNNGISYCKKCHAMVDKYRRRFIPENQPQLSHQAVLNEPIMLSQLSHFPQD